MITIKDKKDAVGKIKTLGLNHFPMDIFDAKDLTSIKKFFDKRRCDKNCFGKRRCDKKVIVTKKLL